MKKRYKSKLTLALLIATFLVPIIAAWLMYNHRTKLDEKTLNYGELITPPFSVTLLQLHNREGKLLNKRSITQGKWTLVLLNPGTCQASCKKNLFYLRQICRATGKNRNRVQRVALSYSNTKSNALSNLIHHDFKETRLLLTNQQIFTTIMREHIKHKEAIKAGSIYLIDPMGNIMMRYRPDENPMNIYNDLSRLLKFSRIG